MELTTYSNYKLSTSIKEDGKSVYQRIPVFSDISKFMENPTTRYFYDEYMNPVTLKSTLFFLWLYRQVEEKSQRRLGAYEKVAILYYITHNKEVSDKFIKLFYSSVKMLLNWILNWG